MSDLAPVVALQSRDAAPALVAVAGERAQLRFLKLFAANIGNANTRWAFEKIHEELT